MEKNNSNIIIRNDGKEIVGYIADLKIYLANRAKECLEICATKETNDTYNDEDFKQLRCSTETLIDLAGYNYPNETLVKMVFKDRHWSVYYI